MLDPLTAVSLAATVVQFVDFTSKVISKTKELRNATHGASNTFSSIEIVTTDLHTLSEKLASGVQKIAEAGQQSENERALGELSSRCIRLSEKLINRMKDYNAQKGDGGLKVIFKATKAVWSRKELDDLTIELDQFRNQLQLRVFLSFK